MRQFLAIFHSDTEYDGIEIDLTFHTDEESVLEALESEKEDKGIEANFTLSDYSGFDGFEPDTLTDAIELANELDSENDDDIVTAYLAFIKDNGSDLSTAKEAFSGIHDSVEDFCETYTNDTTDVRDLPDWLMSAIDWSKVWNSTFRYDFNEYEVGYKVAIFSRNY